MPEASQVNRMFAGIAGRYDIANRVLSLGIDRGWRRRLIQKVSDLNPRNVVDLATGSGDVALEMRQALAPSTEIRGMDFCEPNRHEPMAPEPPVIWVNTGKSKEKDGKTLIFIGFCFQ